MSEMTGWSLLPYLRLSTTIEFFLLRNASCFLGHVPFILLWGCTWPCIRVLGETKFLFFERKYH